MNTKKCPHCGQWTRWNQDIEDRCEHCGGLLSPREHANIDKEKEREKEENEWFKVVLIEIKPEDHMIIKGLKRVVQGFQIVFMAIMSFLIWLITIIAG